MPRKNRKLQAFARQYLKDRAQHSKAEKPFNPALKGETVRKVEMPTPKGRAVVHKFEKFPQDGNVKGEERLVVSWHPRKGKGFVQKTKTYKPTPRDWDGRGPFKALIHGNRIAGTGLKSVPRESITEFMAFFRKAKLKQKGAPVNASELFIARPGRIMTRERYVGPSVWELTNHLDSLKLQWSLFRKYRKARRQVIRIAKKEGYDEKRYLKKELHPENALYDIKNDEVVFTDIPIFRKREARHWPKPKPLK